MSLLRIFLVLVGLTTLPAIEAFCADTGSAARAAVPQAPAAGPGAAAPGTASTKGVGHMFCLYLVLATMKENLDVCYHGQYSDLQRLIDKWLPVMNQYVKQNSVTMEDRKFAEEMAVHMKTYLKSLDAKQCRMSKEFVDHLSQDSTLDVEIQSELDKSDVPGKNTAACERQPSGPGRG